MRFETCIGVQPGYGNQAQEDPLVAVETVAKVWQQVQLDVYHERKILVSAIISPCRAVYPEIFGAPSGGEICALVTGNLNPRFMPGDLTVARKIWLDAIQDVVCRVKKILGQKVITVYFSDKTVLDLRDEKIQWF